MRNVSVHLFCLALGCNLAFATLPELTSWQTFDSFIAQRYNNLSDTQWWFPPAEHYFYLNLGTFPFDPIAMPEVTNAATPEITMGVPCWHLRVRETNTTARIFITEIGEVEVRVNSVQPYDAEAWVHKVYGAPPDWLSGQELQQWYQCRYRHRMGFALTLIPSEHYATYRENLHTATTNALAFREQPVAPQDTSRIAFAKLGPRTSLSLQPFWLYSPDALPVDIFAREQLGAGFWSYRGTVNTTYPFTESAIYSDTPSCFLIAARGDIDSDGDGIPDSMEIYHFGTDPLLWDSSGDGLSDWVKIYRYGLDPLLRDSDGDGYPDDEELLAGSDPTQPTPGASSGSIRYYRDPDDRVIGIYIGADEGATSATLTPAGNPVRLNERGLP